VFWQVGINYPPNSPRNIYPTFAAERFDHRSFCCFLFLHETYTPTFTFKHFCLAAAEELLQVAGQIVPEEEANLQDAK
jgi:hypothetical protein